MSAQGFQGKNLSALRDVHASFAMTYPPTTDRHHWAQKFIRYLARSTPRSKKYMEEKSHAQKQQKYGKKFPGLSLFGFRTRVTPADPRSKFRKNGAAVRKDHQNINIFR